MLCPAPAGFGPRAALRIAQGEGTVGLGGGCSLAACTEAQEGAGTSEKLGRQICSPGLKAGQALSWSLQVPQLHTPLLFFFFPSSCPFSVMLQEELGEGHMSPDGGAGEEAA